MRPLRRSDTNHLMRKRLRVLLWLVGAAACAYAASVDGWPRWRGPHDNGMAAGDAPLHWSDTEHMAWKATVPGKGHSSPVIWGDRLFLTTAVATGAAPPTPASPPEGRPGLRRGGFGGPDGPQPEQKLMVLCFDRNSGKLLWEKLARVAVPHEGYHPRYGSFASNSPVTDGKHVIAFFGSRGVFCYTLDGQLVWQKDMPQLRMHLGFGEGAWPALDGDKLVLVDRK